jgi:hypothetical protein
MYQLKVNVTIEGQISNNQILDSMSCPLYSLIERFSSNLAQMLTSTRDVQNLCSPCISSRSRSQSKVKYHTIKYKTVCCVRSVSPTLIERFSSNLAQMSTSTKGCAEPMLPMCQLKARSQL